MGLENESLFQRTLKRGNVISRYSAVLLILILLITAGFSAFSLQKKDAFICAGSQADYPA